MQPLARPESWLRRVGKSLGFFGVPGEDLPDLAGSRGRPAPLHIKGTAVTCPICSTATFWRREGKLQTTGMTVLGLDAFNASAVCHVCSHCGHILWFLPT